MGRRTGRGVLGRSLAGVVLLATLLVGGAVGAAPAGAVTSVHTVNQSDPTGDVGDPHGDITSVSATYGPSTLQLELSTADMTGAQTLGQWQSIESWVGWALDTNGDRAADYIVAVIPYFSTPSSLYAVLARPDFSVVCAASGEWPVTGAGGHGYRATVDTACLGSPPWVQVLGGVQLDLSPLTPGGVQLDTQPQNATIDDGNYMPRIYSGSPFGSLDAVTPALGGAVTVSGWALDPDGGPVGVLVDVDGVRQYGTTTGTARPDVTAAFPGLPAAPAGYAVTTGTLTRGTHTVCAYAPDAPPTSSRLGCRTFVVDGTPTGNFESARVTPGAIALTGWALDPDSTSPVAVHVYVDGGWGGAFTAAADRPDIALAFPGQGPVHGIDVAVATPAAAGNHSVCVYAINAPGTPGINPLLGCRTVTVSHDATGNLEAARVTPSGISVTGWALDPDATAQIGVHVYVDGAYAGATTAGGARPDVGAAFPGYGNQHGFATTVGTPSAAGSHSVCAYAINAPGTPGGNPLLGCRTVAVTHDAVGNLEQLTTDGGAGTLTAKGWALDPDTASPIAVHVYVDGAYASSVTAAATRPDVGAAFPGYGTQHGFTSTVAVTAGSHTVCAYAINAPGTPGGNPLLGCRRS